MAGFLSAFSFMHCEGAKEMLANFSGRILGWDYLEANDYCNVFKVGKSVQGCYPPKFSYYFLKF